MFLEKMIVDDTMEDGLSKMLHDVKPGFLGPKHLKSWRKLDRI
jgi:hypothetical protein